VRGEVFVGFWWENLNEKDRLRDPGADVTIKLRWTFTKWDVGV